MDCSQAEKNYGHLLQPIRDLAANWNISIADELEEYLEVLESVTFSVEGGQNVNFAEAALLVQGSAHVYSKKVEYLHQLVYQALDAIADRKQRQARTGTQGAGQDAADQDDLYDEEEMFLRLDDVLEAGKDIDLDESGSPKAVVPLRPPSVLQALDDAACGFGSGTAGSFRISSCVVHESGALLLEARDGHVLDHLLRRVAARTSPSGAYHAPPAVAQPPQQGAAAGPSVSPPAADEPMPDAGYDGPDDDDDGGCMGWDGGDDDHAPAHSPAAAEASGWAAGSVQPQPADTATEEAEEANFFDPWAPLDPHDASAMQPKPFRKAKRLPKYRRPLPPALGVAAGQVADAMPGRLAFPEFQPALQRMQQASTPYTYLCGKHFRSGCQVYSRFGKAKRAAAVSRAARQRRSAFAPPQAAAEELQDVIGSEAEGDAEWGDDGGACMDPLSDDDNDYMPVPDAANDDGEMGGSDQNAAGVSYEELCRAHVDAVLQSAAAADVQTDLAARVNTWRSRVQPVIDVQDARESFDMQVYGERILDRLSQLNLGSCSKTKPKVATLTAAVSDTDQWQVSRLFAAMLQLVNSGYVDIERSGTSSLPQLKLYNLQLKDKQASYRAPSQLQKGSTCMAEVANQQEENINHVQQPTAVA